MFALFVLRALAFFLALFPSISLARIVTIAPSDTTSIKYIGAGWTIPRAAAAGAVPQQCPDQSSAAIASAPGAEFSFTFTGTSVTIATISGPGQAPYNVTRDGEVTVVDTGALATKPCYVSYQSQVLKRGQHTITVVVTEPGEMDLLSISYDTGDDANPDAGKPMSTTVTISIAVCCILAFIAIFVAVYFLCCRRNRRSQTDIEHMSMRYKNNNRGILTETPTIVEHGNSARKVAAYHFPYIESKDSSERKASPKPSTIEPYPSKTLPRQPLPVYGVASQIRTIGATETAFSV